MYSEDIENGVAQERAGDDVYSNGKAQFWCNKNFYALALCF